MVRLSTLAALLLTAACTGTVDFELKRQLVVNSTAAAVDTGEWSVDLAQSAPAAWSRRDVLTNLEIHSADLLVTQASGNAATRIVDGAIKVRLDCAGAPIVFASLRNAPITPGGTIALAPTAEGNKALEDALRGSGKTCWSLDGEADAAPVRFTADVTIRMSMGYNL